MHDAAWNDRGRFPGILLSRRIQLTRWSFNAETTFASACAITRDPTDTSLCSCLRRLRVEKPIGTTDVRRRLR